MTESPAAPVPNHRRKVLVIVAHPDDAEFGAAGTVARWAREGADVTYLVCTDGNRGSNDPEMTPEKLARLRHSEQRAAAAELGVKDVIFLGYDDGSLQPTLELRRELARWIRRFRPDVVMCPDPTRRFAGQRYINHPDHRACGDAALDAVMPAASTRLIFPELLEEGLEPHWVKEVYLTGPNEPDVYVDISDTMDVKIAALRQHRSQLDAASDLDFVRQRSRELAKGRDFEYAEAFRYIKLAD
jgi:LmbE family N-acetylglucosaminyl deacetylase